ncbi:S8 family serine peptidase [candidate division KSB1 bacterium]|nr:S8 family serine peptidase [candidate division KSB1 bacterium]
MKSRHNCFYLALFLITASAGLVWAIPGDQALLQQAEEIRIQMEADRAAALALAKQYNWPVRTTFENGTIIELQGLMNGRPFYYITHNRQAATTLSTDKIWPSGPLGYTLTGQTQTLAMWDGGSVRTTHREFGGRVQQMDTGMEITDHATHVAGTLIAAGIMQNAQGMAYQGALRSHNWTNDLAEMTAAAANNLLLSNHSYGPMAGWIYNHFEDNRWAWFGDTAVSETEDYLFGYYLERAQQWDDLLHQNPAYVIVVSAGNDRYEFGPPNPADEHWVLQGSEWKLSTTKREPDGGDEGYDSINGFAVAKNLITVGAVQALPWPYTSPADVRMTGFSCFGPTDDGRIKPDVVADGVYIYSSMGASNDHYYMLSGTSQAVPSVTGSIALLKEHYRNLHGDKTIHAATLKGLVIHTARESGSAPGPDYQYGWGLMNTADAVALISEDFDGGGNIYIHQKTLANSQQIEMQVESDGTQPLKATICWTDPTGPEIPPALNPATLVLVNDLDLRLIGPPGSTTYYPWTLDPADPAKAANTGDNFRDNVEQIFIEAPQAGIYTLRVTHKNTLQGGSQDLSIVLSGTVSKSIAPPAQVMLTTPAERATINADTVRLGWQNAAGASSYHLQVAYDDAFSSPYFVEKNIRVNHYTLRDIPANTVLYWRVNAQNAGGTGLSSIMRSFSIGSEGAIFVWNRITPPELNYQVNALILTTKGYILAYLIPSPSLSNYMEIVGTYRSKDDGATWEKIDFDFEKFKLDQNGSVWGVCGDLYNLGEDGDSHQLVFYQPGISIKDACIDWNAIYLLGYYGECYFSSDRGQTWQEMGQIPLQAGVHTQSLSMIDGDLYAATWGNGAFCSADSGKTWEKITVGTNINNIYCIKAALDGRLLIGTVNGFYTSPPDTFNWQRKIGANIEISKSPNIIVGDHGDVYANSYGCKGPGDGVFVSLNHGETWTTVTKGLHMNSTHAIYKVPGGDLYVGTGTGDVNDGGAVYFGLQETAVQAAAHKLGVTVPGQVTLTSPTMNAVHNLLQITLKWQTVQHGAMYHVQLATDAGFSQLIYDQKIAFDEVQVKSLSQKTLYYWRVRALNALGDGPWSTSRKFSTSESADVQGIEQEPKTFALYQNYPNPFNPGTTIKFSLPKPTPVALTIYNVYGQQVRQLSCHAVRPAGEHEIIWDGRDDAGKALPSGVYIVKFTAGTFMRTCKIMMVK